MNKIKIGIIGGGASGFFAAITAASSNANAEVIILEKSNKVLSKVKISGGGRCNVTNASFENYQLIKNYPRGFKELKKAFSVFAVNDTIKWFESNGVKLKIEDDGRIFPESDSSQTIIDCLLNECNKYGIKILTSSEIKSLKKSNEGKFELMVNDKILHFDSVLIATGGNPKNDFYQWIKDLQHEINSPVPSLFTFNIPNSKYNGLQGISVNKASIRIAGTKAEQQGPILITHWGLSGPAVLRLSAWEARTLNEMNYTFTIHINWIPEYEEEILRSQLKKIKSDSPKKIISSNPLFNLPKRLWERLTEIAEIKEDLKWGDVPDKNINKLIEELLRSSLQVKGKTTFKEEFVTCGGVNLKAINIDTMESKNFPGIYFAGEVVDIDGITGGFNFQAAWTTGYIAGKAMAKN